MIFLSTDGRDPEFFEIINWIDWLKKNYYINSPENYLQVKKILFNNTCELVELDNFQNEIVSFWNRKTDFNFSFINEKILNQSKLQFEYNYQYRSEEFSVIKEYIVDNFELKNNLNKEKFNKTNKLINLNIARKVGFKIPESLITTEKSILIDFILKHKMVVTKALNSGLFKLNEFIFSQNSIVLGVKEVEKISENFLPSFFQEYTNKIIEIRVFYLKGKVYSTAIFSQNDFQTKFDFRNYNYVRPNRVVPFNLPEEINLKILSFMKMSNLETGSIDLIYSIAKEFVFLEVNPEGMFSQVSYPTNFYLEKKLAQLL